ncbi:MAG: 30S ribosomal protein S27e [Candidatus Korarchaeum sp.]
MRELVPMPRSYFIRVRCPKCGNEQVTFSHASRVVRCQVCEEVLAKPRGGRAEIIAPQMEKLGLRAPQKG